MTFQHKTNKELRENIQRRKRVVTGNKNNYIFQYTMKYVR